MDSSNNCITGNNANNNRGGISIVFSSNNNIITGNNACDNINGIRIDRSSSNTITGNTFVNDGLFVANSYQNRVDDNTANGKPLVYLEDVSDYKVEDAGQVILVNCSNITVENLDLSNTSVGIQLRGTEDSKVLNNSACSNNWYGIHLHDSSNNTVIGNNVENNYMYGIHLHDSSNNNIITGNNACDNINGIRIDRSSSNTITGNTFVNDGVSVANSYRNTVENNTVNGKPLVYLEDVSDHKVGDAGQVILVNCNNITVENLDLSNTSVGIELLGTEDSTIVNNTVSNNWHGIHLSSSSNNAMTGNNASNNNWYGIHLFSSSNNIITGNNASNDLSGIYLFSSSNNIITGNNASGNSRYGIDLGYLSITDGYSICIGSIHNRIYLNNFINNTANVHSCESTNIWNSSQEITYIYDGNAYTNYLGNYWDDYEGSDADGDGIGNTAYSLGEDNDFYPLMQPQQNYVREENFRNGIHEA